VRVRMDSKKIEVCGYARAKRVKLGGAIGWDSINERYFYGLRLHGTVDDKGYLRSLVLRKANEHDVRIAPELVKEFRYMVVTGDKGYISKELKKAFAGKAVDIVTKRRKNQLPPSRREQRLLKGHRRVESYFSAVDARGLEVSAYRKTWGCVFHLFSVLLADFILKLFREFPSFALLSSPFSPFPI